MTALRRLPGGDPFQRDDLFELVAAATVRGILVSMAPSVTPTFTRDVAVRLRSSGAKAVSLSLDGASPEVHDRFRGVPGARPGRPHRTTAVRR